MSKKNKLNSNQPDSLDLNIKETHRTRQTLAFHKMDDFSRRQFIQSVGTFLGIMSVPSFIRLETMSKISKKLFGNSMAFAANENPGTLPMNIVSYMRSGYDYGWIICADQLDEHPRPNRKWGLNTITSAMTNSGMSVKFNPHADMFRTSGYQNAIQFIRCVNSYGGHNPQFVSSYKAGQGELCAMASKNAYDRGLGSILKAGFGFYDNETTPVTGLPDSMTDFIPTRFTRMSDLLNQFTPPVFKNNAGTTIPNSLINRFVAIQESSFNSQFDKALYQKGVDKIKLDNAESYKILTRNFRAALDLNDPSNAAIKTQLTNGVTTIPNRNDSLKATTITVTNDFIDPAYVWFAGIRAYELGITPGLVMCNFLLSDWHGQLDLPSNATDPGTGDPRTNTGAYFSKLIYNFCEAANASTFTTPAGGQMHLEFNFAGEFTRGPLGVNDADDIIDNPDGYTDALWWMTSNKNQTRFAKTGCFGGHSATGRAYGFNPTNFTHSINIEKFDNDQAFTQKAKYFNIDNLSDFGITSPSLNM